MGEQIVPFSFKSNPSWQLEHVPIALHSKQFLILHEIIQSPNLESWYPFEHIRHFVAELHFWQFKIEQILLHYL
jgi:hypothetical protein